MIIHSEVTMEKTLVGVEKYSIGKWCFQIVLGSLVIGLFAQLRLSLPFSPVPFTGQTFAIMGIGAILGSKKGGTAALLYLIEGAFGWPVFAGGSGGILHFMGPTGGYLLTYPLVSYFVGKIYENELLKPWTKVSIILYISTLQLSTGSLWLAYFVGLKQAYLQGFFPFILLEFSKVGMVWTLIRGGKR